MQSSAPAADLKRAVDEAQRAAQQAVEEAQRALQDARTAAKDARTAANDARVAATDEAAGQAGGDAQQPAEAPNQPGTIIINQKDGPPVTLNVDGSGIRLCQEGSCTTVPIKDIVPRGAVLMTFAVFGSLAFMVVGYPLARALAGWINRRGQTTAPSRALQERLDAMERNIDTVAVEVERVSEGQRFTNKLLEQRTMEHAQRSDR